MFDYEKTKLNQQAFDYYGADAVAIGFMEPFLGPPDYSVFQIKELSKRHILYKTPGAER